MGTAVFIVRMVYLLSLMLALFAALSEYGVLGSGKTLGMDSLGVMLWSGAIAALTAPILVSFLYPRPSSDRTSEDEEVAP